MSATIRAALDHGQSLGGLVHPVLGETGDEQVSVAAGLGEDPVVAEAGQLDAAGAGGRGEGGDGCSGG
jgi:hypothetical protein